jgi:hypothetical protein
MRIWGLRLGEGNQQEQRKENLHFGSIIELITLGSGDTSWREIRRRRGKRSGERIRA